MHPFQQTPSQPCYFVVPLSNPCVTSSQSTSPHGGGNAALQKCYS